MGGIWSVFLLGEGYGLYESVKKVVQLYARAPSEDIVGEKITRVWAKCIRDGVSLLSTKTNIVLWAHEQSFISLQQFLPAVKALGHSFSVIVSVYDSVIGCFEWMELQKEKDKIANPSQLTKLQDESTVKLLEITSSVCLIAWSVLSLIGLYIAAPIIPVLTTTFLVVGSVALVSSLVYMKFAEIYHEYARIKQMSKKTSRV